MIRRLVAMALLLWIMGFALFVLGLPRPDDTGKTDAIVVLTGGPGRIERGMVLLQQKKADHMLISGVNRDVLPRELAVAQKVPLTLFTCCIDLGHEAIDTRSNAGETARWLKRRKYKSVRLITTDWHMRRAQHELERAIDPNITVIGDAVKSQPSLMILFKEYNKYLLSRFVAIFGL